MKVLGGSRKESSKYLRVQGGRVLHQFTIRVKLPQEPWGRGMGFDWEVEVFKKWIIRDFNYL
jgi:hypothetical protein